MTVLKCINESQLSCILVEKSFVLIFSRLLLTDEGNRAVPGLVQVEDATTSLLLVETENRSDLLDDTLDGCLCHYFLFSKIVLLAGRKISPTDRKKSRTKTRGKSEIRRVY